MPRLRQFETIFARHPLPTWVFDTETLRFLEVNEAACREYGYSRDEFLAMTILDIRPPQQRPFLLEDLSGPALADVAESRVWLHRRKDGSTFEAQVHGSAIEFDQRPARLIMAENVSAELAAKRELAWRANHDVQTKLWNEEALVALMQRWDDRPCRIACVQLRGLELIEDSLGAPAGNRAVRALASRLQRLGQRHGICGRVRDDEFVLAVSPVDTWPAALEELRDAIGQPLVTSDSVHQIDGWIGTMRMPGDTTDPAQAIALARIAVHAARSEGIPVLAYDASMALRASDRLQMAARLRHAVEHQEFTLAFQPIRRIGDGATIGLEALLRWPQADGSLVSPTDFVPVSEDTGLIVPLGRWVLRQAAEAHRRLADAGLGELSVAVNVSHAQISRSDFSAEITRVFDEYKLPRGALHIELTESVLMARPDQTLDMLGRLHNHGICVSLDDFGTGFSNMSYLQQLPIDALKIDRSFVQDVQINERNAFICRALIALGHGLDLQVVAEGVETDEQYEWLRENGCDQAQGFGLGRPVPLDEVIGVLSAA